MENKIINAKSPIELYVSAYLPQCCIVLDLPLKLLPETVNLVPERGLMLLIIVWSQASFPCVFLRWVFVAAFTRCTGGTSRCLGRPCGVMVIMGVVGGLRRMVDGCCRHYRECGLSSIVGCNLEVGRGLAVEIPVVLYCLCLCHHNRHGYF